jgi:hypothetical protein
MEYEDGLFDACGNLVGFENSKTGEKIVFDASNVVLYGCDTLPGGNAVVSPQTSTDKALALAGC